MTRRQHLQKAADHLAEVMEHLQLAGEDIDDLINAEPRHRIDDLINAEPRGRDTDDAYEQGVEDGVL